MFVFCTGKGGGRGGVRDLFGRGPTEQHVFLLQERPVFVVFVFPPQVCVGDGPRFE